MSIFKQIISYKSQHPGQPASEDPCWTSANMFEMRVPAELGSSDMKGGSLGEVVTVLTDIFQKVTEHPDNWLAARKFLVLAQQLPNPNHLLHTARGAWYSDGKYPTLFYLDSTARRAIENLELGHAICDNGKIVHPHFVVNIGAKQLEESLPEAVWVARIYAKDSNIQAARVAFNFHMEDGKTVLNIANVQGRNKVELAKIHEACNDMHNPGKTIPWAVETIRALISIYAAEIDIVRGVPCTLHPSRNRDGFREDTYFLYDLTFRNLGMVKIRDGDGKLLHYELQKDSAIKTFCSSRGAQGGRPATKRPE